MAEKVRFYYDFASPYTYLASTQVDSVVLGAGGEVEWIPVLLGAVMKATGNVPPASLPARALYMGQDLPRWAGMYGVPFVWTPHFPLTTTHALRAALAVREAAPDKYLPFVRALFDAAWARGENIGDRAMLATVAGRVGVDGAMAAAASDDQRWKDALRAGTEEAVKAGAFGAPTFAIEGTGELFFGNDRLELLAARLRRGKPWDKLSAAVPAI